MIHATDWTLKTFAFLHDPPDKPFALARRERHEEWGRELAEKLTGRKWNPEWERVIRHADRLASGTERSGVFAADPPRLEELRHALSGQKIDLAQFGRIGAEAQDQAKQALEQEIAKLADTFHDPRQQFLALWCLLPHRLRSRRDAQELGALWDWLPADTRMPNHPVALHQALVSALATIIVGEDEPALLLFSIGPVQNFIVQARRSSDLWGGSAMLSHALCAALAPIVDELGPDHVVFPALRRSTLFLKWLTDGQHARLPAADFARDKADYAALPNRFLAIVPAERAVSLGRAAAEALGHWWRDQAASAANYLEKRVPELRGFGAMACEQVDAFLQVAWASTPWPDVQTVELNDNACKQAAWIRGGQVQDPVATFIARQPERGNRPGAKLQVFPASSGMLYGASYDAAQSLLDAVKRSRPVPPRAEHGLKCSLCGERSVSPDPLSFDDQKAVWRKARSALGPERRLRQGEALCGVCWTKRWFGQEAGTRVPSTSEIAASPFKQAVIENFDELGSKASDVVAAASQHPAWRDEAYVVPALRSLKRADDEVGAFVKVPGEILLRNPREDREPDEDDEQATPQVREALHAAAGRLRKAAAERGLLLPRPYLAVVVLDGDEMGRRLSGEFNRQLGQYLSSTAKASLEEAGMGEYLARVWPMTPALHTTFSEACGVFSQLTAPRTLHDDGLPAFLIYAGGDDVLALTAIGCPRRGDPVELATEAVLRLRLRFSGHVRRGGETDVADPTSPSGFVVNRDGLGLAFGQETTASAGLAIFHHRWPLGRALAEARRAEHRAKEQLGRNALAISILRRSGQVTETGLRFFNRPSGGSPDDATPQGAAVRALQRLAHGFAFDMLSPRFLTEIKSRLAPFHGGLSPGELIDLARPLVLEALGGHVADNLPPEDREALEDAVVALARAAAAPAVEEEKASRSPKGPPPDLLHLHRWIDLIEVAAFLGRGGEE